MPKLYTKTINQCIDCPNYLTVTSISPVRASEQRCTAVIYRNSVYRLIHGDDEGDEGYITEWCPLEPAEPLPLPF